MTYKQDIEIDLKPHISCRYIISSQHRKIGNRNKCIWTISNEEEVNCFVLSISSDWKDGSVSWGLKIVGEDLHVIGENDDNEKLKIAKFVDGNGNDIWHGYPADCKNRKQDIPSTNILFLWAKQKYIDKSDVRKLKQQMPCNL